MTDAIWLDHAATSWPKPKSVVAAITRWFEDLGVDASRGTTDRHQTVRREVDACRRKLAELCATESDHVVFCSGATEAINIYLRSVLADGDVVWTTALEHNAVARPLHALRVERNIDVVTFVQDDGDGGVAPDLVADMLEHEKPPRLLVYNHVSNVTGALSDLSSAAPALRAAGCKILVDCAQSAGRLHLDRLDVDALAFPAHKGLQGPPGLGVLALRDDTAMVPLRFGGTGSSRPTTQMPETLPAALEAGTPNTPAILGLGAGIDWVLDRGLDAIHDHERAMAARLREGLADLAESGALRVFGGRDSGVLAIEFADLDPHEAAMSLAADQIFMRAGFHCTAVLHGVLRADSGTLRASTGPNTTEAEVDTVLERLRELAES